MALLVVAAAWARTRGRRLLAVTVNHGLNTASREWSGVCATACASLGVDWIERRWEGDKPTTGLTAAARSARHALIAEAARDAGAKVVLMAHTADDIAEADWMRARSVEEGGSTLGRVREWSPSPAWPQGRGLMLLRPLLEERRGELRDLLQSEGVGWIEDPANGDERFGRSRARSALNPLPEGEGLRLAEHSDAPSRKGEGLGASRLATNPSPFRASPIADALGRSSPLPLGEGFGVDRSCPSGELAAALVCAGGGVATPRGDRLAALAKRLRSGQDFTATLAGARIEARGTAVLIGREAGELKRRGAPDQALLLDEPTVWDGRYEITVREPGWTVGPAAGRMAALSDADRTLMKATPAALRATLPVLFRDGGSGPVLAWRRAEVLSLSPRRLSLALGETTHEADLFDAIHGETPPTDLFSHKDHHDGAPHGLPRDREP